MDAVRLGLAVRAVRRRQRLSQQEVASRARVSQQAVSRIERGRGDRSSLHVLSAIAAALGASLTVEIRTADPFALRDERHARVQAWLATVLRAAGWSVEPEVSFNHYGDRGRIDLAAHHQRTGILLIVEVKTRIDDVQDVLGRLDVKTRLGGIIARERGWTATRIVPALVVATGSDGATPHSRARGVVRTV